MDIFKDWLEPEVVWFLIGFVFILMEFALPGLITIFFGIGAWLVAIICLVVDIPINLQLFVFITVSVLFLFLLRTRFQTFFQGAAAGKESDSLDDEFVGQRGIVTKAIGARKKGKIEIHGSHWNATAKEPIEEGATVEILAKDNITLIVIAIKEEYHGSI